MKRDLFLIASSALILSLPGALPGQNRTVTLSPLIGDTLDASEHTEYRLLEFISGFQKAVFTINPDSTLSARVWFVHNGQEQDTILSPYRSYASLRKHFSLFESAAPAVYAWKEKDAPPFPVRASATVLLGTEREFGDGSRSSNLLGAGGAINIGGHIEMGAHCAWASPLYAWEKLHAILEIHAGVNSEYFALLGGPVYRLTDSYSKYPGFLAHIRFGTIDGPYASAGYMDGGMWDFFPGTLDIGVGFPLTSAHHRIWIGGTAVEDKYGLIWGYAMKSEWRLLPQSLLRFNASYIKIFGTPWISLALGWRQEITLQ